MASTYSDRLRIELIGTGEQSGIWGDTTNTNLGTLIEEAIAGVVTITMTDANYTLSEANGATDESRQAVLVLTGTLSAGRNVIAPAEEKVYIVKNSTTGGFATTIKTSSGSGYAVPNGKTVLVYCDGTDFHLAADATSTVDPTFTGNISLDGAVVVNESGGNNDFRVEGDTDANLIFGDASADSVGIGTNSPGSKLDVKGTLRLSGSSSGYVGLAPASAAGSTTYTLPSADGTNGQALVTNGTGTLSWGATGISAASANTFTALQTFSGSTSVLAMALKNAAELATVSATAATGTINYDVTTQSVLYYTSNASGNFTINFRASSGTSLNTAMATGDSVTVAFLCTNGGTAYYNSAVQVDGNAVTPKWQGGAAPSAGNASSIDTYVYTIVKTGSATFTVAASQTKFA